MLTMTPQPGSAALGLGKTCPATDQLGNPRKPTGCTAGAIEVPLSRTRAGTQNGAIVAIGTRSR